MRCLRRKRFLRSFSESNSDDTERFGQAATGRREMKRGEVARRVEVTGDACSAATTGEDAFGQAQFGCHHATRRARFGTGISAVRDLDAGTAPADLVCELSP